MTNKGIEYLTQTLMFSFFV